MISCSLCENESYEMPVGSVGLTKCDPLCKDCLKDFLRICVCKDFSTEQDLEEPSEPSEPIMTFCYLCPCEETHYMKLSMSQITNLKDILLEKISNVEYKIETCHGCKGKTYKNALTAEDMDSKDISVLNFIGLEEFRYKCIEYSEYVHFVHEKVEGSDNEYTITPDVTYNEIFLMTCKKLSKTPYI